MKPSLSFLSQIRGYSLADTLVATAILAVAVSAAATLSLSMTTQEEIGWRVSRGASLLENAATVYGLGLDAAVIPGLMPTDAHVSLSAGAEATESIAATAGNLSMRAVDFTATINTVDDVGSWSPGTWTGGGDGAAPQQRTATVRVYRSRYQTRFDQ